MNASPSPTWTAPRRHRIKDIAEMLSLSTATVCRALSNKSTVRPETRQRVLAAAEQLAYVKDTAAMALRTGRHRRIAMLLRGLDNPYYVAEAEAARRAAEQQGYAFHFFIVDPEHLAESFERILSQSMDGLLVFGSVSSRVHEHIERLVQFGTPVLRVKGDPDDPLSGICVDLQAGYREAMNHLLAGGHRRFGLLGIHPTNDPRNPMALRRRAIEATLHAHGLDPATALEILPVAMSDESIQGSFNAVNQRLAQKQAMPTALLASNDVRAMGALAALTRAGWRVPEDISLIGCDNIEASAFLSPALTTIQQSPEALCQAGVAMLLQKIEQPDQPIQPRHLQASLVVRASTADASVCDSRHPHPIVG